jgi:hypothetical protein
MLDKLVSPIACVNKNHQNQLEKMANEAMFATLSGMAETLVGGDPGVPMSRCWPYEWDCETEKWHELYRLKRCNKLDCIYHVINCYIMIKETWYSPWVANGKWRSLGLAAGTWRSLGSAIGTWRSLGSVGWALLSFDFVHLVGGSYAKTLLQNRNLTPHEGASEVWFLVMLQLLFLLLAL